MDGFQYNVFRGGEVPINHWMLFLRGKFLWLDFGSRFLLRLDRNCKLAGTPFQGRIIRAGNSVKPDMYRKIDEDICQLRMPRLLG